MKYIHEDFTNDAEDFDLQEFALHVDGLEDYLELPRGIM